MSAGRSGVPASVVVIQTSLGDYRQQFIDELEARLGDRIDFLCGADYFEPSTRTRVRSARVRAEAGNIFFGGRRMLWQRGVTRAAVAADVAVLEFNPRIVNSWTVLALRRLLRRPTVLWGHAWSRSGPTSRTEPVRRLMRRIADVTMVYTEAEAVDLRERGGGRVLVAPNAIYARKWMVESDDAAPAGVVWIGRMVPAKKPELALRSFAAAIDRLPPETSLTMVGDGPLRPRLEDLRERLGLRGRVHFAGNVSDVTDVGHLFGAAVVGLATGYVGLNLIQSLGFGVPMIYVRDEPHAPEISAATQCNTVAVSRDDADALAEALVHVLAERDLWLSRRPGIIENSRSRHSVEAMADGFIAAVEGAWRVRRR